MMAVLLVTATSWLYPQTQPATVSAADAYKNAESQPFGYKLAPIFLPRDAPGTPTVRYLSLNDHGEAAFNAEWKIYQIGYCSGGVYTNKRVVANCGDLIQYEQLGKVVDDPNFNRLLEIYDVQIDNGGLVYYLATYVPRAYYYESPGGIQIGLGFFIERNLVRGYNGPPLFTPDSQKPDRLVKGTDGHVYLFTRDGRYSTDGKQWTAYKQGSGPPGLDEVRDQRGLILPENLPLPLPWQPAQIACGPVINSVGARDGRFRSPYRKTLYNSERQPVLAVIGDLGTRSVINADQMAVPLTVVADPVAVVTPAGKLLQEVGTPPVQGAPRGSGLNVPNSWKGMNLTLTQVDFAARGPSPGTEIADRVLMNRKGQIAFRASGTDASGRAFIGVIATPLKSINCSPPSDQNDDDSSGTGTGSGTTAGSSGTLTQPPPPITDPPLGPTLPVPVIHNGIFGRNLTDFLSQCSAGDAKGCHMVGASLERGWGTDKNPEAAKAYYGKACSLGRKGDCRK